MKTNHDESSDNSRSAMAQAIDSGNQAHAWKAALLDTQKALEAAELRAEKAEAESGAVKDGMAWLVEMVIRDERIKGTPDTHGWIRKALECGQERRKEVQQAERERDEAKEYNQIVEANAAHADARIEALQKERDALRAEVGKITVERDSARDLLKDALATMTRLREALEEIKVCVGLHGQPRLNVTELAVYKIAQAALAGKGTQC